MAKYFCKECYETEGKRYFLNDKTCPHCDRQVTHLPKVKLSHLKNNSISRFKNDIGINIESMQQSNQSQDNWKSSTYKRPEKSKIEVMTKKEINCDIFDEKDKYEIVVEGTKTYYLKDDILTLGDNDMTKEILIPKNINFESMEVKDKNNLLIISFKKK